ncbi:hypothetical protein QN395_03465 [Undibacterium sp. RTI2.2]|nr:MULTISPECIES: hypothetical protein [unclassified Undibacterium]MDY7537626.1 hypothetical protein [Undibacterium sp. 5I1]MEB0115535.1 hypothetical protein [Undibacterium sp. RTI2.2]MEB0230171.1 hypothetical protein [Undibacterium sp. 10I3]MEB0256363.1 hypothetical protein [Undibacterium sp. 5I1]
MDIDTTAVEQFDIEFIPKPPTPAPFFTKMTIGAWMKRIAPELPGIYKLAATDIYAQIFRDMTLQSLYIDINDPDLAKGLDYFKAAGIFTDARAHAALTMVITFSEAYKGEV